MQDTLVIANDNKEFPFKLPHVNVSGFLTAEDFKDWVEEAISRYTEHFGKLPKYLIFDTISKVWLDIESHYARTATGFNVYSGINKDVPTIRNYIENEIIAGTEDREGISVIFISHSEENADGTLSLVRCGGNSLKDGGIISDVDYAIYLEVKGKKRIVRHRGNHLSRCLIDSIDDVQNVSDFNLQEYLDLIHEHKNEAESFDLFRL